MTIALHVLLDVYVMISMIFLCFKNLGLRNVAIAQASPVARLVVWGRERNPRLCISFVFEVLGSLLLLISPRVRFLCFPFSFLRTLLCVCVCVCVSSKDFFEREDINPKNGGEWDFVDVRRNFEKLGPKKI